MFMTANMCVRSFAHSFFFGGFSCISWLRPKQAETTINFQRMNEMWIKCKQRKCLMWTPNATQTRSNNNKNCWIFIFNWRMKRWKKKRNNRNQLEFTDSTWFIYCRRFLPRNRFRTFFFSCLCRIKTTSVLAVFYLLSLCFGVTIWKKRRWN